MPIADTLVDEFVHERLNLLWRRFLQTARGAFDRVSEADDGAFFCLRLRSAVTEAFLGYIGNIFLAQLHDLAAGARVFVLLQRALIKITDDRSAVMFLNDIDDALIQFVFESEINPFLDVRHDDQCAHRWRKLVVRIPLKAHVFGEVFRFHELADVVEVRTDTAKRGVGADCLGRCFSQVGHDQAVVVSPGRFDGHPSQQRMVKIGSFQPGNVRGDLE